MNVLDALILEEKRLDKLYNEWTDYEKMRFAKNTHIGEFQNDSVSRIDQKIDKLVKDYNQSGSHSKIERYVTLRDLFNFVKNNYQCNIWNQGICNIKDKFNDFEGYNSFPFEGMMIHCYDDSCIEFQVQYRFYGSYPTYPVFGTKKIQIHKKNEQFFLKTNTFDKKEQKVLLTLINCEKIYNACQFSFNSVGLYHSDEMILEIPIDLGPNYFCLGRKDPFEVSYLDFGILYYIDGTRCEYSKNEKLNTIGSCFSVGQKEKLITKLKYIYLTDPDYLDHISIKFSELPLYIQENLFKVCEDKQEDKQTDKKKTLFKRIFKRKFDY